LTPAAGEANLCAWLLPPKDHVDPVFRPERGGSHGSGPTAAGRPLPRPDFRRQKMTRTTLRLALVGTGGRGQIYADVLRRMEPGAAEWAALCDIRPDVLARFCADNGLADVPQVIGVERLLERDDLDAVLICTPDHAHRQPAEACYGAGLHCLVEKPVATTLDDARAICAAAQRAGRLLQLGFVLRFDPCARRLRELVAGGAIGQPVACLVHEAVGWFHGSTYMRRWNRFRKFSGDMLLHKGCHTLDIINAITGAYPARVAAFGGLEVFRPRPDAAGFCRDCGRREECIYYTDQGPAYQERFYRTAGPQVLPEDLCVYNADKDTTDTTALVAEYDNGMRLSYTMTMVSPQGERRLTLVGTKGEIRCDLSTYRIEYWPLPDRPLEVIQVPKPTGTGHQHHDQALLAQFLQRIREGADPAAGIRDAYMSGAVAFAALQSMETGQFVPVPPL
jgi:predicted dehydrogenase